MVGAYNGLSEYSKAIEYFDKSLVIRLKLHPDGLHPDLIESYKLLSLSYSILSLTTGGAGEQAFANEYAYKADSIEKSLKGK